MTDPLHASSTAPVERARRKVLDYVARQGPVPPTAMPGHWPATRHHARLVVGDLTREGLVRVVHRPPAKRPLLSLTTRGRAALEEYGTEERT
jgi:DNA-binding MarR family transcriptional regulator